MNFGNKMIRNVAVCQPESYFSYHKTTEFQYCRYTLISHKVKSFNTSECPSPFIPAYFSDFDDKRLNILPTDSQIVGWGKMIER